MNVCYFYLLNSSFFLLIYYFLDDKLISKFVFDHLMLRVILISRKSGKKKVSLFTTGLYVYIRTQVTG